MNNSAYSPPVDQLLTLGETNPGPHDTWLDYAALGIGPEHIPELFRMANDESLNQIGKVEGPEDWASIHAVRAIGQLRDASTIQPLVELLTTQEDHEWIQEELPDIFSMIGPAAIPALAAYLADDSHPMYGRSYAAEGLITIAKNYPESRDESIGAIVQQLEKYSENDPELNAFMISDLAHFKAAETLPLIEQAYKAGSVDESIIAMDDVLVYMGLKEPEARVSSLENFFASLQDRSPLAAEPYKPPPTFNAPPKRIFNMNAPSKFSGKKISGKKKAKRGKRR
jgi:Protein of unknown function (DUF1186)